jgi:hypothetical protein
LHVTSAAKNEGIITRSLVGQRCLVRKQTASRVRLPGLCNRMSPAAVVVARQHIENKGKKFI